MFLPAVGPGGDQRRTKLPQSVAPRIAHYAYAYDPGRVVDEAVHNTSSHPDILHIIAGDLQ